MLCAKQGVKALKTHGKYEKHHCVQLRGVRIAVVFSDGAGYGSRTRLLGLGSRCTTDVRILHMKFSLPCSARQIREYSGSCAASVSLRIFFWLRQKLRCVASRPSVDGKMLAIEPRVRSGAHIPKRNAIHLDGISFWQAAPFKITMISPVLSRVSATFGNLFPRWRSVLFNGHCATPKDIA